MIKAVHFMVSSMKNILDLFTVNITLHIKKTEVSPSEGMIYNVISDSEGRADMWKKRV